MTKYCDYCSEEATHHFCDDCAVDPRIAVIEAQRDAAVKALQDLRALFAGDPGGEFVVTREDGKKPGLGDQLIVGEAMAQATAAIAATTGDEPT